MATKRPIVHPTDFSDSADVAFEEALRVARNDDTRLLLVHVIEPVYAGGGDVAAVGALALREAAEAAARRAFDRLLAAAKTAGVDACDVLRTGFAAEEIAKLATERDAALIVMGTHGRTGLRRLVMGSVADRVLALAPCPVLTVRMT